jgi:hypothetical protein
MTSKVVKNEGRSSMAASMLMKISKALLYTPKSPRHLPPVLKDRKALNLNAINLYRSRRMLRKGLKLIRVKNTQTI